MHKTQNKKNFQKPVSLIGMPGSGKSTIGRNIAELTGCEFIDSDALIQKEQGVSISQLFETKGEPVFRDIEKKIILNILSDTPASYVLSTGGGAIMTEEIRNALLEKTILVFLNVSLQKLWSHLEVGYQERPLLAGDAPKKRLENLLEKRLPVYSQAHITLNCDDLNAHEITEKLVEKLNDET